MSANVSPPLWRAYTKCNRSGASGVDKVAFGMAMGMAFGVADSQSLAGFSCVEGNARVLCSTIAHTETEYLCGSICICICICGPLCCGCECQSAWVANEMLQRQRQQPHPHSHPQQQTIGGSSSMFTYPIHPGCHRLDQLSVYHWSPRGACACGAPFVALPWHFQWNGYLWVPQTATSCGYFKKEMKTSKNTNTHCEVLGTLKSN